MFKNIVLIAAILLFPTTVFYLYFLSKEKLYNHISLTGKDFVVVACCLLLDIVKNLVLFNA